MYKTAKFFFLGLLFNIAFGAHHIIYGIVIRSWWFFTIGVYYAILGIVRFVVFRSKKQNRIVKKFAGAMLITISLSLVCTVILSVIRDRGIVMHMIIMIAMAAYSFTKITVAAINLVKARKSDSAKHVALRNISLADACVSIFALQRSMLVSFSGNMSKGDIGTFNTFTGAAVCIIVFLLGVNLMGNKSLLFKKLDE